MNMNVLLWIVQIALALHTVVGAVWKFSNTEQTVPSLRAIPHGAWQAMSIVEIAAGAGLILPAFVSSLGVLAPLSAAFIAAEMLLFSALHLASRDADLGPLMYWLVVAAISAFIAVSRFGG